jgi:hypothetical protein
MARMPNGKTVTRSSGVAEIYARFGKNDAILLGTPRAGAQRGAHHIHLVEKAGRQLYGKARIARRRRPTMCFGIERRASSHEERHLHS